MLQVDEYARMRLAYRDGMSIREIARRFQRSRQVVRKALANATPPGYQRRKIHRAPKLDPVREVIDQILSADHQAPRKQRHTALRIFERLVAEHGYQGSYHPVRRYVKDQRRKQRETFVPLAHDPGQRLECDFGHIYVDFPEGRRQVAVLLLTWSYSHFCFAMALPSEKTEAILEGMVRGLEFFQCVPREVWWDNPTTVATKILTGRERQLHPRYKALACHYNFEPCFCRPRRGNEKPNVENRVKRLQQTWCTPVPQFADLQALNAYLLQCCQQEAERTVQRTEQSIGVRFQQEVDKALPLPVHAFDPCVTQSAIVDKYQTVRFDTNWYSIPRPYAFQTVTIKAYTDSIAVVVGDKVIARHPRCYERHAKVLDPLHYLAVLPHKPAVLQHSEVLRSFQLPSIFGTLLAKWQQQFGDRTAMRHYIRVLQLLAHHPIERIGQAIDICMARGNDRVPLIENQVERLARRDNGRPIISSVTHLRDEIAQIQIKQIGLAHFDQLLKEGEITDACQDSCITESQSEGTSSSHDAGGVRATGPRSDSDESNL